MVVEDAPAGIQAAKSGGMYAAGVGEAAKDKRADVRLTEFSDLLEICKG